jgi:hypothetical protein
VRQAPLPALKVAFEVVNVYVVAATGTEAHSSRAIKISSTLAFDMNTSLPSHKEKLLMYTTEPAHCPAKTASIGP